MFLQSDSAVGARFLASMAEGRGLKPSARAAGVGKETAYRWLREQYLLLRAEELSTDAVQEQLGYSLSRVEDWEREHLNRSDSRHHLRVPLESEAVFWREYDRGASTWVAGRAAGVSRSTAHRWLSRRFAKLRGQGLTMRQAGKRLRLAPAQAREWEAQRREQLRIQQHAEIAVRRRAIRDSARYIDALLEPSPSLAHKRRAERHDTYWKLMREGVTNAEACRILGMSRTAGTRLRRRNQGKIPPPIRPHSYSGRYLSLRERLRIADLLKLGCSMRQIATELGRHPSTIMRELDRHRDPKGRYLPRTADHDARLERARPRPHKLVENDRLRMVVQRKLNRCWSPDEICGWLKLTYPDDSSMRLCPETIYRALLVAGGQGLHQRYRAKLRTGRKIRKSRWLTRSGHGSVVRNMTMIDQRPPEVETKKVAGHWEGDLIVGIGSASAMMTLRERKTHYGIVVNLPLDHTAESVNNAAIKAFAAVPSHLKKTLTWDQGVEMAKHQELTKTTGIDIYFAERSSPWQRGANENYNGLTRQYFPKGTDLAVHSDRHVNRVMRELNDRPRKTLGYLTPAALFKSESKQPQPSIS